jgi:tetratricopeptide (TPR) repeat protein
VRKGVGCYTARVLKRLALSSFLLLLAVGAPGVLAAPQRDTALDSGPPSVDSGPAEATGSPSRGTPGESTPPSREASYHFALGKLLAAEHSYAAAEAELEKAIELDPKDPYLRIEFIEFLDQSNRPVREMTTRRDQLARAVEHARVALELAPDNPDVLRTVGQVHLRMADFDPESARIALDAFSKVREMEPWDVQTMVALGQLHLSRGQFAEAAEIFEEASRYVPNNRILYNFLADARERAGQDKEAAEALRRILSLDPGDLGTRIRLAEILGSSEDHAGALEVLDAAPPSNRDDRRLLYLRARELFLTERPEEALELTDRLEAQEDLNRRLRLYVTDLRARILARLDRSEEAFKELTALLELDPGNSDLLRRVTAQLAQGGHDDEARSLLEKFIEHHGEEAREDPEVARSVRSARLALAAFLAEKEAWDEALAALEPMLSSSEEETRRIGEVNSAEVLYQAGRTDEALDLLEKDGSDAPALIRKRVELLLRSNDESRARRLMRASRRSGLEPGLAAVQAFQAEQQYKETLPVLEELTEKNPSSLEAHFLLGVARERTGAVEDAAKSFLRVLEIDPEHDPTLNYLGYMWADRGENLERALELVQHAVEIDPHNGAYIDSLGWAYYRLGRYTEARENLERAVRLAPGDPVVYEHLGDVYAALGDNGKAAEFYRRALQVAAEDGSSDQDLRAVQRKLDELTVD